MEVLCKRFPIESRLHFMLALFTVCFNVEPVWNVMSWLQTHMQFDAKKKPKNKTKQKKNALLLLALM